MKRAPRLRRPGVDELVVTRSGSGGPGRSRSVFGFALHGFEHGVQQNAAGPASARKNGFLFGVLARMLGWFPVFAHSRAPDQLPPIISITHCLIVNCSVMRR